jgi:hypothetical protein
MAVWAYECRSCGGNDTWLVSRQQVDGLRPEVRILRVKAGAGWRCAIVDRSRPVAVEAMLVRDAVASDAADCPECAPLSADRAPPARGEANAADQSQVQGAAIALGGQRLMVVLVDLDLVRRPGEADMRIADLRPRFGGIEVVLMGQEEDGTPRYHGDAALVRLLEGVPVDRMPWKAYAVG